jgi:hypothetical protein
MSNDEFGRIADSQVRESVAWGLKRADKAVRAPETKSPAGSKNRRGAEKYSAL